MKHCSNVAVYFFMKVESILKYLNITFEIKISYFSDCVSVSISKGIFVLMIGNSNVHLFFEFVVEV